MPFAYYSRLSRARKAVYRQSDAIVSVPLPTPEIASEMVPSIARALADEEPVRVQQACQILSDELMRQLEAPLVQIIVLEARPSNSYGELHGLYEPGEPPYRSRVTLWMRTAQQEKVVAFRSFLRTLIHELLHHLDYEIFEMSETFHTQGFYKRESNLFHQLMTRKTTPPDSRSGGVG